MRPLILVTLLAAFTTANGDPGPRTLVFCPECWTFAPDLLSVDPGDVCRVCWKRPVEVPAGRRIWYWCEEERDWKRAPTPGKTCCSPRESPAIRVDFDAQETFPCPCCPECKRFFDASFPADSHGRCLACGKPPVTAEAVRRAWFWCRFEPQWSEEPCWASRARHCCTERSGLLLASHEGPISGFPAARFEPGLMLVTPGWLEARLRDPNVLIVHVGYGRDAPDAAVRDDYERGHIPGAVHLKWVDLTTERGGVPDEMPTAPALRATARKLGIRPETRVVLYDTGFGLEAARAYVTLDFLGFGGRVSLLDGHWKRWLLEQRPVSVTPAARELSETEPGFEPDVLVNLPLMTFFVWLHSWAPGTVTVLDARGWSEFSGEKRGRGVSRGGHIPGARHLFWRRTLVGYENPTLKTRTELEALFGEAGNKHDGTLIVYCRTGVESSQLYFVAKHLGYPVRLYDGSYAEWSTDPLLPIVAESAPREE